MEPLPHIDALLDGTRGSCFFTKLDLASSYHQLRVRPADRWKTSFRSQLGRFQWDVVPFGLQVSSSLLMRVMNQALTMGLDFTGDSAGPVLATSAERTPVNLPPNRPRYTAVFPGRRVLWACARWSTWTIV